MDLQTRWEKLWAPFTGEASIIQRTFERLCAQYSEPHRAYHTLRHIDDCLTVFDEFKHLARRPEEAEAAVWWHDLVYDTSGAVDNEGLSAMEARADMSLLGCPAAFQERVAKAIVATKHTSAVTDRDQQLVLDIDLHSLGTSPIRYKQYVTGIRREYEWVPWPTYAQKRMEILGLFLSREYLFYLPALRERYEYQARRNIRREIAFLKRNLT